MLAHRNPFRSACVEALPFRFGSGEDASSLLSHLIAIGGRGVLVGAKGSGKTTLLETLAKVVSERGQAVLWLRLRQEPALTRARVKEFLATDPSGAMVCLDGLEQLHAWAWWRVRLHLRRAAGLIATSHSGGRLPLLRRHVTSPELLADLVQELTGGCWPGLEPVWQAQAGDIRQCLAALYQTQLTAVGGHRLLGRDF